MHGQSVVELNSLVNFGFRNSFSLNMNRNFVLILLRDFIAMDSPLKLASR